MASILVVCTGNICRSPAGEILLQGYLGDLARVTSAGTHAMVGQAPTAPMLDLLAADGFDGSGHRASQLTAARIEEADLIIAMTAAHRRWVLQETPSALAKTFLLTELAAGVRGLGGAGDLGLAGDLAGARADTATVEGAGDRDLAGVGNLAGAVDLDLARARADAATVERRVRGLAEALAPVRPAIARAGTPDVPDPYLRGGAAYQDSYAMIRHDSAALAAWLLR